MASSQSPQKSSTRCTWILLGQDHNRTGASLPSRVHLDFDGQHIVQHESATVIVLPETTGYITAPIPADLSMRRNLPLRPVLLL